MENTNPLKIYCNTGIENKIGKFFESIIKPVEKVKNYKKINVRGVWFDNLTLDEAVKKAYGLCCEDGCSTVFTPNSLMLQNCVDNNFFRMLINSGDLIIPDGQGVLWAAKKHGTPLKEKVAGVDLAVRLLPLLAENKKKLFLLGSDTETVGKAAENINKKYGNIVCGEYCGYYKNEDEVINLINLSKPDVVFICLGSPKQELFIKRNKERIKAKLMLGLGGTIDVVAGKIKRAPDFFVKCSMEWLWRVALEPKRIKNLKKLPKYIAETITETYKFKSRLYES